MRRGTAGVASHQYFLIRKEKNKHRRQRRNNSNQDYNLQWRLAIRAARRQDAYSREEDSWQRIRSHINIRIIKEIKTGLSKNHWRRNHTPPARKNPDGDREQWADATWRGRNEIGPKLPWRRRRSGSSLPDSRSCEVDEARTESRGGAHTSRRDMVRARRINHQEACEVGRLTRLVKNARARKWQGHTRVQVFDC